MAAGTEERGKEVLDQLALWANAELRDSILPFWVSYGADRAGEGFFGEIDASGVGNPSVDRSVVMAARQLWTFSAAARFLGVDAADGAYRSLADYAVDYLLLRFLDPTNGGFYWTVNPRGAPVDRRKQTYGQAFAIYGLSEYAMIPGLEAEYRDRALNTASATFEIMETHVRDQKLGGYLEALGEDWGPVSRRALSEVDIDCDKSMNTNLHVLEALTNLYRVLPSAALEEASSSCLRTLSERICQGDGHLGLFFNADWSRMEEKVSYGHDIEASWLMEETLELLPSTSPGFGALESSAKTAISALAATTLAEGIDPRTGALEDEAESALAGAHRTDRRIWWCQAEAMVGFLAAWERTGDGRYADAALAVRDFVHRYLRDAGGEWLWGTDASGQPLPGLPKGGNWKTGYHTGRACMELIRRSKDICEKEKQS